MMLIFHPFVITFLVIWLLRLLMLISKGFLDRLFEHSRESLIRWSWQVD